MTILKHSFYRTIIFLLVKVIHIPGIAGFPTRLKAESNEVVLFKINGLLGTD